MLAAASHMRLLPPRMAPIVGEDPPDSPGAEWHEAWTVSESFQLWRLPMGWMERSELVGRRPKRGARADWCHQNTDAACP